MKVRCVRMRAHAAKQNDGQQGRAIEFKRRVGDAKKCCKMERENEWRVTFHFIWGCYARTPPRASHVNFRGDKNINTGIR